MKTFLSVIAAALTCSGARAQNNGATFPCPEKSIAHYTAYRSPKPIVIDGKLDDATWQAAPTSSRFVDILSGQPALHNTRAAVIWDDAYLYVSYQVQEP